MSSSSDKMKNNCTNCNYAQATQIADDKGNAVIGQYQYNCLRFPPSAFAVPTPQGVTIGSAFPVVNATQVCSLYEPQGGPEPPTLDA